MLALLALPSGRRAPGLKASHHVSTGLARVAVKARSLRGSSEGGARAIGGDECGNILRLNQSRPGTWSICGGLVMQFGLRPGMSVLVSLIALLAACGGGSSPTPLAPSPREISPIARSYLAQLLDIMQANSVSRKTIDWSAFRQTVIGVESNAQTIQDLYPRIRAALSLLNDHHSFYVGPDETRAASALRPAVFRPRMRSSL